MEKLVQATFTFQLAGAYFAPSEWPEIDR